MVSASSWVHLGHFLFGRILMYLPCVAHRAAFAGVCWNWFRISRKELPGEQLPWLLLPSSAAAQEPCFYCLLCRTTHRAALPDDVRGARFCGFFDDDCLILALQQTGGYVLHWLNTGRRVFLPEVVRTAGPVDKVIHAARAGRSTLDEESDVVYIAAIAAWPASAIAFWRLTPPEPEDTWSEMVPCGSIADVLYYVGHGLDGFHVLTDDEEVLVYALGSTAEVTTRLVEYRFPTHEVTRGAIARYLVKYGKDLLMVARIVAPDGWTRAFHVFKLVPKLSLAQDGDRLASWEPMHVIPTGIIVLGRCCSSSYPTYGIDFDGVYFLDDATSSQDAATGALEPTATRQYP